MKVIFNGLNSVLVACLGLGISLSANAAPEAKTAHEAKATHEAVSAPLKALPARKTASVKGALHMSDKQMRAEVLKMRYCTFIIDGTAYYQLKFHSNGNMTVKNAESSNAYSSDGAYDDNAYKGSSGAGDDAYNSSTSSSNKGSWSITKSQLIVKFPDGSEQPVFLTKDSASKHQCF